MPTFKITDPTTGKTIRVTGDSAPTESELNDIFGAVRETPTQTKSINATTVQPPTFMEALLPRSIESNRKEKGIGSDLLSAAGDVLSILPRGAAALGTLAGGGSSQDAISELAKTKKDEETKGALGYAQDVAYQPSTYIPMGAALGLTGKGLGLVGTKVGLPALVKLGETAKMLGGANKAVVAGAEPVKEATKTLALRSAVQGATQGAIGGAVDTEDHGMGAGIGFGAGALLGGGIPLIGKGIGAGVSAIRGKATDIAEKKAASEMEKGIPNIVSSIGEDIGEEESKFITTKEIKDPFFRRLRDTATDVGVTHREIVQLAVPKAKNTLDMEAYLDAADNYVKGATHKGGSAPATSIGQLAGIQATKAFSDFDALRNEAGKAVTSAIEENADAPISTEGLRAVFDEDIANGPLNLKMGHDTDGNRVYSPAKGTISPKSEYFKDISEMYDTVGELLQSPTVQNAYIVKKMLNKMAYKTNANGYPVAVDELSNVAKSLSHDIDARINAAIPDGSFKNANKLYSDLVSVTKDFYRRLGPELGIVADYGNDIENASIARHAESFMNRLINSGADSNIKAIASSVHDYLPEWNLFQDAQYASIAKKVAGDTRGMKLSDLNLGGGGLTEKAIKIAQMALRAGTNPIGDMRNLYRNAQAGKLFKSKSDIPAVGNYSLKEQLDNGLAPPPNYEGLGETIKSGRIAPNEFRTPQRPEPTEAELAALMDEYDNGLKADVLATAKKEGILYGKQDNRDFLQELRASVARKISPAAYRKLMDGDNASAVDDKTLETLRTMTARMNDRLRLQDIDGGGQVTEDAGGALEQYFGAGTELHPDDLIQAVREAGFAKDKRMNIVPSADILPSSLRTQMLLGGGLGGVSGAYSGYEGSEGKGLPERIGSTLTGGLLGGIAGAGAGLALTKAGRAELAKAHGVSDNVGAVTIARDEGGNLQFGNVIPKTIGFQSKDLKKAFDRIEADPRRHNPEARAAATDYFDGNATLADTEQKFYEAQNRSLQNDIEFQGRDAREKKMLIEGETSFNPKTGKETKAWSAHSEQDQSIGRAGNEKTRGGVYTFDTSKGCVGGSCVACYAGNCGNQAKKIHFDAAPVWLRGDINKKIAEDPAAAFRIGETGEPASNPNAYRKIRKEFTEKVRAAQESGGFLSVKTVDDYLDENQVYDWSHTVNQIKAVKGDSKEAANKLFIITKLPTLKGFDPRVIRNLQVSIDPAIPAHAFRAMKNIEELLKIDPTLNISVRTKSYPSMSDDINSIQAIAAKFAKEHNLEVLDTPTRVRSIKEVEVMSGDREISKRNGIKIDDKGEVIYDEKTGLPKRGRGNQFLTAKYLADTEAEVRANSTFKPFADAAGIDDKKFLVCNKTNIGTCATCRNCFKTASHGTPSKIVDAEAPKEVVDIKTATKLNAGKKK